jgi:acetyl/propionyl-CoA carboxylase alpha subunit
MIAKVITHGENRSEAIRKMQYALSDLMIAGITTNQSFLKSILKNDQFKEGNFDTHFLDKVFKYEGEKPTQDGLDISVVALQIYRTSQRASERKLAPNVPPLWRNNLFQAQKEKYAYQGFEFEVHYQQDGENLSITFADKTFTARLISEKDGNHVIEINGIRRKFRFAQTEQNFMIHCPLLGDVIYKALPRFSLPQEEVVKGGYAAPMPGEITKVLVEAGQEVKSGEALLVMISMKMETTIEATDDGIVEEIYVEAKQFVESGTLMLKMKE